MQIISGLEGVVWYQEIIVYAMSDKVEEESSLGLDEGVLEASDFKSRAAINLLISLKFLRASV